MSELKDPSGASNVSASGDVATESINQSEPSGSDSVQLSTHKKLLGEKKTLDAKYQDAIDRLNALEEKEMMSEGKKDELIESYKNKISEMQAKVQNFAYSSVENSVKAKAREMGCVDEDAIAKLVDLSSLNVDANFNVDGDDIGMLLEGLKKDKSYLFRPKNPNVSNGVPNKNLNLDPDAVDFSKMSIEEIKAYGLKNNIK